MQQRHDELEEALKATKQSAEAAKLQFATTVTAESGARATAEAAVVEHKQKVVALAAENATLRYNHRDKKAKTRREKRK